MVRAHPRMNPGSWILSTEIFALKANVAAPRLIEWVENNWGSKPIFSIHSLNFDWYRLYVTTLFLDNINNGKSDSGTGTALHIFL